MRRIEDRLGRQAVPAVSLFLLPRLVTRIKWPFARNRDTYLFVAGIGMALYLGWSWVIIHPCRRPPKRSNEKHLRVADRVHDSPDPL